VSWSSKLFILFLFSEQNILCIPYLSHMFSMFCPSRPWFCHPNNIWPIPVAARSKAWVCGHCLRVRIPPGASLYLVSVVCCQVEVSASGRSLVQRSPTECGESDCDREASIMRGPWPTRGCCVIGKKKYLVLSENYDACHYAIISSFQWDIKITRTPEQVYF
jgi:hypothetical protein